MSSCDSAASNSRFKVVERVLGDFRRVLKNSNDLEEFIRLGGRGLRASLYSERANSNNHPGKPLRGHIADHHHSAAFPFFAPILANLGLWTMYCWSARGGVLVIFN